MDELTYEKMEGLGYYQGSLPPSASTPMLLDERSSPGQRQYRPAATTPRQPAEDGQTESSGRKSRGKVRSKQKEFACPFFKYDPLRYGKCRDYTHWSVANLLKDHIGKKHLRAKDLDVTTWERLTAIITLRGAPRYKAIYAILFPSNKAGIQNPYFDEGGLSASLLAGAQNLPNADSPATLQEIESMELLDATRRKKETQVWLHAEDGLSRIRRDFDAQITQCKEAAIERQCQILSARDEQLERIRRDDVSQRLLTRQTPLESSLRGIPTETSAQPIEADVRSLTAINNYQLTAGDQRYSSETERAYSTPASSTLANNVQSPAGIRAANSMMANPRFFTRETFEPERSTTYSFGHQGSSSDIFHNDRQHSSNQNPHFGLSNYSLPSSAFHSPTAHVGCECCGQDHSVGCDNV